jgi:hypothetical protein
LEDEHVIEAASNELVTTMDHDSNKKTLFGLVNSASYHAFQLIKVIEPDIYSDV